ncbi:CAP domain-containing protein [Streptomyces sp. NPDC002004]
MSKHRRTTHYRKITVAAVAMAAVAVPSAAMACGGPGGGTGGQPVPGQPGGQLTAPGAPMGMQLPGGGSQPGSLPGGAPMGMPAAPGGGAPEGAATPGGAGAPSAPSAPTAPGGSGGQGAPSAPEGAGSPSGSGSDASASDAAKAVLKLVNSERSKAGCSALTINDKLTKAAEAHSKDMAAHQNMSHSGSDGSDPGQRITKAGYNWSAYGENVAYGYATPDSVVQAWMASAGHKRNILDCSFKETGISLAEPGHYWTQDFGTAR